MTGAIDELHVQVSNQNNISISGKLEDVLFISSNFIEDKVGKRT